jgi:hypothetical protein
MENKFFIPYKGVETLVELHSSDRHNNTFFRAYLPDEDVLIEYTEDDEGAGRWLDAGTHHQTQASSEIGELIDLYVAQHKSTI